MRQIYRPEANSLKQTISTHKSNFEDDIYGEGTQSPSQQQSPTKIQTFRISYQENPTRETKSKPIYWHEITPKHRFSDITYSNDGANDVVIVGENQPNFGFEPRKKVFLWILVIFIMIAAIGNAAYWSVVQ